jgi:DNA-directed RNA polymerase subunit RPC12/RpoP
MPRRVCLVCGGKLEKLETRDNRWKYLEKRSYYACESCSRRWLYSPELTCPVLLQKEAG